LEAEWHPEPPIESSQSHSHPYEWSSSPWTRSSTDNQKQSYWPLHCFLTRASKCSIPAINNEY